MATYPVPFSLTRSTILVRSSCEKKRPAFIGESGSQYCDHKNRSESPEWKAFEADESEEMTHADKQSPYDGERTEDEIHHLPVLDRHTLDVVEAVCDQTANGRLQA